MLKTPSLTTSFSGGTAHVVQLLLQIDHVAVSEHRATGLGQTTRIDDAGVVRFVGDDGIVRACQRWNQALIGVPAAGVAECGFGAEEFGRLFLQRQVAIEGAADEAHAGRAGAVGGESLTGGFDDLRVIRQTQIVVRAEHQDVSRAVKVGHRAHGCAEASQNFVGSRLTKTLQ